MFKEARTLFLYAETSLHAGSGEALGAIDLAIQRERHTDFPTVASQGLKGPVRDVFERAQKEPGATITEDQVLAAFGPDTKTKNASEHAGAVAFTDARLLLFPVASLKGVFAWVTCPFVLDRFRRDLGLGTENQAHAQAFPTRANLPRPDTGTACGIAGSACKTSNNQVMLLDEVLTFQPDQNVQALADWLAGRALPSGGAFEAWGERLAGHLLILSDDDFRHFVKTATEVQARIKLENDSKTVAQGGLFYQENLPPESLLYTTLLAADARRKGVSDSAADVADLIEQGLSGKVLQIGGDETTGKGYVRASFLHDPQATGNAPAAATAAPQAQVPS